VDSELPPEQWSDLEKIRYLLLQWGDIFDQGFSRSGPPDPDHTPALPAIAHHPSIVELDRCLGELFVVLPVPYRHLKAARVSVQWRIAPVRRRFILPSGRKEWLTVRERQPLVPRWVEAEHVAEGEGFLVAEFDGPVFIPKPLWRALTEPVQA